MKPKIVHYLIVFVFIFGIYGASGLVLKEYQLHQVCPQILSIPACYIIMACLIVPFVVHVLHWSNKIYFAGTGLALLIATYGSITNFMGIGECPKTGEGTPMCYLSFFLFLTLVSLKLYHSRTTKA